ncbi:hypothetical protein ACA910_017163 [Epithemia clementina (nom. ined.)]
MYCGDETGSFIGDVGSHLSRFGYGGDDSPKYVVPSYVGNSATTTNNGNSSTSRSESSKTKVLMSCYNQSLASGACRTPMRCLQSPPSISPETSTTEYPIVHPANYLQQGQEIVDWDAYEQLWQSAFDIMHVRDRLKHTVGGGSMTTTTTGQEDDKSADAKTKAASGVASTTIRPGIQDYKCVHPLLAVSPGFTHLVGTSMEAQAAAHRKQHIQLTEMLMEKFDCPAMFIAPAPMLAAFSHGRQTALVVDMGAGGCRVTPVVDGFLLKQSQRRNGRGGDWLGNVQWKALLDNKTLLRPRYQQTGGNVIVEQCRGIFHRWAMQDLMFELRSSKHVALPNWQSSRTPLFPPKKQSDAMKTDDDEEEDEDDDDDEEDEEEDEAQHSPPNEAAIFELPDGTLIDLTTKTGKDLCRVPELLFAETLPFLEENGAAFDQSQAILDQHTSLSNLPLHQLIHSSLSAVGDVDARKDLAASILLTGGSSLFAGMEERLSYEVSQHVTFKTKVLASRYNVERSCASWIGGSILTSLGSFQQLWLGRTEYNEYGVTLGIQRFP